MDEPFGRQPQPLRFTLEGETEDMDYWIALIKRLMEGRGGMVQMHHRNIFTYYPRAVNE